MRAFAHDRFTYPLPEGHRFPLGRYRMLRQEIEAQGLAEVVEAPGATDADLLLAHHPLYLERALTGRLSDREQKSVGLPWSPELVEREFWTARFILQLCIRTRYRQLSLTARPV
jgi:acetoin utilization deacetylase AcuC-like enzyme